MDSKEKWEQWRWAFGVYILCLGILYDMLWMDNE
jgi:hypothetical protein